jgi:hypothetical protein
VQFALITGTSALFGGLTLVVGGGGTKYGLDEFQGQLGDSFCKSDLVRLKVWHVIHMHSLECSVQGSSRRSGIPF